MRSLVHFTSLGLWLVRNSLQAQTNPEIALEGLLNDQQNGTSLVLQLPQQDNYTDQVLESDSERSAHNIEDASNRTDLHASRPTNEAPLTGSLTTTSQYLTTPALERSVEGLQPIPIVSFGEKQSHPQSRPQDPQMPVFENPKFSLEPKETLIGDEMAFDFSSGNPLESSESTIGTGESNRRKDLNEGADASGGLDPFSEIEQLQAQMEGLSEQLAELIENQKEGYDAISPYSQTNGGVFSEPFQAAQAAEYPSQGIFEPQQDAPGSATNPEASPHDMEQARFDELFGGPLTEKQYRRRNWMWLRCLTKRDLIFDVGGMWPGPNGKELFKVLRERVPACGVINWRFEYVNGQDWGDAKLQFNCFLSIVEQYDIVNAMIGLANEMGKHAGRELYIYNCPEFEHMDTWFYEPYEWQKLKEANKKKGEEGA